MRRDYGRVLLFAVVTVVILGFMKYVLPYFLPLLVALVIVVPLHIALTRRGKGNGKGSSIVAGGLLFVLLLLVALLLVGIGTFMMSKAQTLAGNVMRIEQACDGLMQNCCGRIEEYMGLAGGSLYTWLSGRIDNLRGFLGIQGSSLITKTVQYLMSMGKILSFLIVSFICVVLFAREIDGWKQGLLTAAAASPAIDRLLAVVLRIGKRLGSMMKTFLLTQSIILACISVTAVIGLSFAGVKEGWFYGILAGIMDVLPFIGTGIVLVPITVMQLLEGHILSAAIVFVTYVSCVCIREILEPRLMGNGTQVSAVAMLIAVYAGVLFYGIGGVLLGPVTLLILVEIAKEIFYK